MKFLLVSDIHGCRPALQKVLKFYDENHCDMLCILGDILNYGPRNRIPEGIDAKGIVDDLNARAHQIIALRGNCDAEVDQMLLQFPIMADYVMLVDGGKRLFLTHGHLWNEHNQPTGPYDVLVCGHSHLWTLQGGQQPAYVNLGSITFPKGGKEPTFATYEDGTFSIYRLDGKLLEQMEI